MGWAGQDKPYGEGEQGSEAGIWGTTAQGKELQVGEVVARSEKNRGLSTPATGHDGKKAAVRNSRDGTWHRVTGDLVAIGGTPALPTKETASHRRHLLFSLCWKSSPQEAVKTVQRCHEPSPGLAQRRHLTGLRSTVQTSASWQNAVHQADSQGAAVGTRGSVRRAGASGPRHWPRVRHVMPNGSIITKGSPTAPLVTPSLICPSLILFPTSL